MRGFLPFLVIAFLINYINGLTLSRMIGGSDAPPAFAPHQVIITYTDVFRCSGVIIHQHAVLTAAQCFLGESPSWFKITAGTNKLHSGGRQYPIHYYVIHPNYNQAELKNDLALGIVKEAIELGPTVSPIRLGTWEIEGGLSVVTSGWGMTSYIPTFSETMKNATLQTVDNAECSKVWEGTTVSLAKTEICAIIKSGGGMCYGDGGNPLVYNNTLIGIASWGVPCSPGFPDVYQRVGSYLEWIYQTLKESPFTTK